MYKFITVVFSKLEFVDSMMDRVGKHQFDIYQTISSLILVNFFVVYILSLQFSDIFHLFRELASIDWY